MRRFFLAIIATCFAGLTAARAQTVDDKLNMILNELKDMKSDMKDLKDRVARLEQGRASSALPSNMTIVIREPERHREVEWIAPPPSVPVQQPQVVYVPQQSVTVANPPVYYSGGEYYNVAQGRWPFPVLRVAAWAVSPFWAPVYAWRHTR
jgi:hypothetical protein